MGGVHHRLRHRNLTGAFDSPLVYDSTRSSQYPSDRFAATGRTMRPAAGGVFNHTYCRGARIAKDGDGGHDRLAATPHPVAARLANVGSSRTARGAGART